MSRHAALAQRLGDALSDGVDRLYRTVGSETVYGIALYTSGEDALTYVIACACTEEGLARIVARHAKTDRAFAGEAGRRALRWWVSEWEHHDFAQGVRRVRLPPGTGRERDRRIFAAMSRALGSLDRRGAFAGRARPTLAIACGDMSEDFFERWLGKLNGRAVAARYRNEHTPGPFLDRLAALSRSRRDDVLLRVLADLTLTRSTPLAVEARSFGATEHDVAELAVAVPVSRLLDLARRHALAPTWNRRGSQAWRTHGAFTPRAKLAMTCLELAQASGLRKRDVAPLQRLIARRIATDRGVRGPVSLVPALAARGLHDAFPRRFPEPAQSPATNRLENAEAFLDDGS